MSETKPLTASQLRADVYRVLDRVLATGEPVEIVRRGARLRIVKPDTGRRLADLPRRPVIVGDPEELVELDWSDEWAALEGAE